MIAPLIRMGLTVIALAGLAACSLKTAYVAPALRPADVGGVPDLRIILVGDAGVPLTPDPVLAAVRTWAAKAPDKTVVLFLGDNAYPRGLVPDRLAEARHRLQQQIDATVTTGAKVVFVPGNHDWDKGGPRGFDAVGSQASLVGSAGAELRPSAGCPGPEAVPLPQGAPARVVTLDTQWWLHKHMRGCSAQTFESVVALLQDQLDTELPVVVAAHHPLATHGPHGGFDDWRAWLFPLTEWRPWAWLPLPGVGPLVRALVRSDQDLVGSRNRRMVESLTAALRAARPSLLLYVAGHEHSLQILSGAVADYVVVSGTGSSRHSTRVGKGADTLFAQQGDGFMMLEFRSNEVRLAVVTVAPEEKTRYFALSRRR